MFRKLKDADIETIIEFSNNNISISETSRKLFLHRNSVVYHLEKVERVTGLSPFRFYDLIQLMQLAGVITIQSKYFKSTEGANNEQQFI